MTEYRKLRQEMAENQNAAPERRKWCSLPVASFAFVGAWMLLTVFKESGTLDKALGVKETVKIHHDLNDPDFEIRPEDMDTFVYRHSVLDTLQDELHEAKGSETSNSSAVEQDSEKVTEDLTEDLGVSTPSSAENFDSKTFEITVPNDLDLSKARSHTQKYSTLPRTLDSEYNYLAPGEKYFIYSPSGGFNNQLMCLVDGILFAKKVNRTLIVPMAAKHSNLFRGYLNVSRIDLVEMDMALDLKHLQALSGVRFVPLNTPLRDFVESQDPETVRTIKLPSEGLLHPTDKSIYRRLLRATEHSVRKIVYLKGRFFTAHWLDKEYWANARYAPYLQTFASKVHHNLFEGNYNAMHIRLGDYEKRSEKFSKDGSAYLASAIEFGFEKHVPLYIAAEEPREYFYFKPLLEYFDKVVFQDDLLENPETRKWLIDYTLRTPASSIRNDLFGLIEQLICSRATKFLGTHVSTFSLTISVMRRRLSGSIPELYDEIKNAENSVELQNQRWTGSHNWRGNDSGKIDKFQ
eukprot:CAMPEP_0184516264 /NCGR_PEP_ID=MMETSP0198_2-20121128/4938_1 /TAXON_ID=1112570 /ORGANISM="Thraustochytrium sp., Strain LLF1b" /LENGTH=519 /DNA_ID=CAMNT_0026906577 /DNA_START=722 /DNA_END=2281 /DNA_ORIENTATION=-